jgi:hypothetical protein
LKQTLKFGCREKASEADASYMQLFRVSLFVGVKMGRMVVAFVGCLNQSKKLSINLRNFSHVFLF